MVFLTLTVHIYSDKYAGNVELSLPCKCKCRLQYIKRRDGLATRDYTFLLIWRSWCQMTMNLQHVYVERHQWPACATWRQRNVAVDRTVPRNPEASLPALAAGPLGIFLRRVGMAAKRQPMIMSAFKLFVSEVMLITSALPTPAQPLRLDRGYESLTISFIP